MIVGTGKDSDCGGNGVVFDTRHGLLAVGTDRSMGGNAIRLGNDRVHVFGGVGGDKVGQYWGKKMTAAALALIDSGHLAVGGFYFDGMYG